MAEYDFIHFYKQAYLKEKKKNAQLAAEAASKEQAVTELRQKYERIAGNPVIRLLRGVKKIPAKLTTGKNIKINDIVCRDDSVSVKQYEKEVLCQKNPYVLWMSEHEKPLEAESTLSTGKSSGANVTKGSSQVEIVYMEQCGKTFSPAQIEKPYILFTSKTGRLSSQAVKTVEEYFNERENTALVYAAEDTLRQGENGEKTRENPWFKPAYSPETLLSFFYFGNVFAVRKEEVESLTWRKSDNWKENIYDFILKAEEQFGEAAKEKIAVCDKVLFHKTKQEEEKVAMALDESAIKGLWGYEKEFTDLKLDALERRGKKGYAEEGNIPGIYHMCIEENEKISIVILSKDNQTVLEQCVKSIREKTDYANMEIIVVDNGSFEANRMAVEELSKKYEFTYLCEPMEFNFSAMCNIGAKAATGKYLLLLNDDIEVLESGWLRRMAGQASVKGVGAVGAKLWYPDSVTIQHAGITNLAIGPAHKLVASPDSKRYYDGRNCFTFNFLAVTGACLMIKKELYEEAGGLDESMPIAYNDVEFCFRLHKMGYRNVLRNDCILYHHESLSRGLDEQSEEKAVRLLEERKRLYQKYPSYAGVDEYYSPALVQDAPEYRCGGGVNSGEMLKPLADGSIVRKGKALSDAVLFMNIEKTSRNDNKVEVRGWSVLKGADNCHYKRSLILEGMDSKKVYVSEAISQLREDVQNVFSEEKRIELSGFLARFSVKNIENGTYKIGILYEDMLSDKVYYRMAETYMEI